jgi:hypothetical protein
MELSEDERNQMLQDARDRWLTDYQNALNYKYRSGQKAAALEIAQKMKARGATSGQIAEDTGFSPEEIAAL